MSKTTAGKSSKFPPKAITLLDGNSPTDRNSYNPLPSSLPNYEEYKAKHPFDRHDDLKLNYPNQLKPCEELTCVEARCVNARVANFSRALRCGLVEKM